MEREGTDFYPMIIQWSFYSLLQVKISQKSNIERMSNFKLDYQIIDSGIVSTFILCDNFSGKGKKSACYRFLNHIKHPGILLAPGTVGTDDIDEKGSLITIMRSITFETRFSLVYNVKIHKYLLLVIHFNENIWGKHIFFDGPSLSSSTITHLNNTSISFSSFQATFISVYKTDNLNGPCMHMTGILSKSWDELNHKTDHLESCIQYSGQPVQMNIMSFTDLDERDISLPKSLCQTSNSIVCLMVVQLPPGTAVNLIIKKLGCYGPAEYNDNCNYGGLSVYLHSENSSLLFPEHPEINENISMCYNITHTTGTKNNTETHDDISFFKFPISSNVDFAHIITYGYKEYSRISVIISLHAMLCDVQYITLLPAEPKHCGLLVTYETVDLLTLFEKLQYISNCQTLHFQALFISNQELYLKGAKFCPEYNIVFHSTLQKIIRNFSEEFMKMMQLISYNFPMYFVSAGVVTLVDFASENHLQPTYFTIRPSHGGIQKSILYFPFWLNNENIKNIFMRLHTVTIPPDRPIVDFKAWELPSSSYSLYLYPDWRMLRQSWFTLVYYYHSCRPNLAILNYFSNFIVKFAMNQYCFAGYKRPNRYICSLPNNDYQLIRKGIVISQAQDMWQKHDKHSDYFIYPYQGNSSAHLDNSYLHFESLVLQNQTDCYLGSLTIRQDFSEGADTGFTVKMQKNKLPITLYLPASKDPVCSVMGTSPTEGVYPRITGSSWLDGYWGRPAEKGLFELFTDALLGVRYNYGAKYPYCLVMLYEANTTCLRNQSFNLLKYQFIKAYHFDTERARKLKKKKDIINMCEFELLKELNADCSESVSWMNAHLFCRAQNMELPSILSTRQERFWSNLSIMYHLLVDERVRSQFLSKWNYHTERIKWKFQHRSHLENEMTRSKERNSKIQLSTFYKAIALYIGLNNYVSTNDSFSNHFYKLRTVQVEMQWMCNRVPDDGDLC